MEQLIKKILEHLGIDFTEKRFQNLAPIISDKSLNQHNKAVEICDTLGIDEFSSQRNISLRTIKWLLN